MRVHGKGTGTAAPEGEPAQMQLAQAAQWVASRCAGRQVASLPVGHFEAYGCCAQLRYLLVDIIVVGSQVLSGLASDTRAAQVASQPYSAAAAFAAATGTHRMMCAPHLRSMSDPLPPLLCPSFAGAVASFS